MAAAPQPGGRTPRILGILASTTVAFALSRGLTLERIEMATGLSGLDIVNPEARLPDDVLFNLWRMLMDHAPGAPLSIEMAKAAPLSALGGLAHGAQFAGDLRAALGLLIANRFFIADRLHMELIEREDEAVLITAHPNEAIDGGRACEVGAGLVHRLVREVLGIEDGLRRVDFKFANAGPKEAYTAFFGVPVRFNQPHTAVVFNRDALSRPVSHANLELFSFVETYYDQKIRQLKTPACPAELSRLREVIIENASRGDFGVASAAARANLSLRSAQRLAQDHGISLQKMIDDVRMETAKEILLDPSVDLQTLAALVGYSDDRSFRRAFKRWTGATPSQYRMGLSR